MPCAASIGNGRVETSVVALGTTATSQVIPAGEFTLEARLPGGRVLRKPVVLLDGATTDVAIDF